MIGIVYKALDSEGKIVKIGSTAKTLKFRQYDKCYVGLVLSPVRIDEYEDSDFGILHLRIRETIEISRHKTWSIDGGLNILNPIKVWICGIDHWESRSGAGRIGGRKTFRLHGNPATKEGCILGGSRTGDKNKNSGWASKLGKEYGGSEAAIKQLEKCRTKEHQISAGRKGGEAASKVNEKTGWSKKLGTTYGRENASKIPFDVKMRALANGRHNRWHVKRWIINPDCQLCRSN